MRWSRVLDIAIDRFESYMKTPFDVKFIRGLFALGAVLIGSVLGYKFIGSASADIKREGFSLSLKFGTGPEMAVFYVGVLFVLVSIFLYWKYLSLTSPAKVGNALCLLLQRGLENVTAYEIQLAVHADYKFNADPLAIPFILSRPQPLFDIFDYKNGNKYLRFVNGAFVLNDVSKVDFSARLHTVLYFVFGPLAFCFFQAVLIFCVQKQWSCAAVSGALFGVFALLSWSSLSTHSAISAARRLV